MDYSIPFDLMASIEPAAQGEAGTRRTRVTLHGGDVLWLERAGDLGEGNGGLLVFAKRDEGERPAYVPWAEVERVDLDRP